MNAPRSRKGWVVGGSAKAGQSYIGAAHGGEYIACDKSVKPTARLHSAQAAAAGKCRLMCAAWRRRAGRPTLASF